MVLGASSEYIGQTIPLCVYPQFTDNNGTPKPPNVVVKKQL